MGALEERRIETEQEQRREMRKMELELKMIEEKRLEREAEAEQKKLEREAEAEQKRLEREAEHGFLCGNPCDLSETSQWSLFTKFGHET